MSQSTAVHMSTKQTAPLQGIAIVDSDGQPTPAENILRGMGETLLTLVCESAPREQLANWLRVPLEHAGAKGDLECVLRLLAAGANPCVQRTTRDRSPLAAAAQGGNGEIVSALLDSGAAPDGDEWETSFSSDSINTNGWSPLHFAASGGHKAVVKELLKAGAGIDVEDEEGCSALHLAVFRGYEEVVEELVAAGANVNTRDSEGETPLHTACSHGNAIMVRAILKDSQGGLVSRGSMGDHLQMSPLHRAALGGHCDVMREILEHDSCLELASGNSLPVFHAAALSGNAGAVRFLLERDVNNLETEDQEGKTALHLAAGHRLGSDGTLVALLEAGADVDHTAVLGETALHAACKALRVSAVQILLRAGANEAAVDIEGHTAADMASRLLHSQCPGVFRDMLDEIMRSLSKAPIDRVWRRRGWLLMLRSRERPMMVTRECTRARKLREIPSVIGCNGLGGGKGTGLPRHLAAGGDFHTLVERVLGIDEDGVFRTLVSFI